MPDPEEIMTNEERLLINANAGDVSVADLLGAMIAVLNNPPITRTKVIAAIKALTGVS
jgi:hypothetical protein